MCRLRTASLPYPALRLDWFHRTCGVIASAAWQSIRRHPALRAPLWPEGNLLRDWDAVYSTKQIVIPAPGPRGIDKFRGWYQAGIHCPAGTYLPLPRPLCVHHDPGPAKLKILLVVSQRRGIQPAMVIKQARRPARNIALCALLFAL